MPKPEKVTRDSDAVIHLEDGPLHGTTYTIWEEGRMPLSVFYAESIARKNEPAAVHIYVFVPDSGLEIGRMLWKRDEIWMDNMFADGQTRGDLRYNWLGTLTQGDIWQWCGTPHHPVRAGWSIKPAESSIPQPYFFDPETMSDNPSRQDEIAYYVDDGIFQVRDKNDHRTLLAFSFVEDGISIERNGQEPLLASLGRGGLHIPDVHKYFLDRQLQEGYVGKFMELYRRSLTDFFGW